jgi:hypothetical protein
MRQGLAIFVLLWVFLLAPGFCLGAIGTHDCQCGQAGCQDCQPEPGEAPHSHGCHDDPCPKDVCRTDPDEIPDAKVSSGVTQATETLAFSMNVGFMPADSVDRIDLNTTRVHPDEPPRLARAELFALGGLPLLI